MSVSTVPLSHPDQIEAGNTLLSVLTGKYKPSCVESPVEVKLAFKGFFFASYGFMSNEQRCTTSHPH